MAGRQVGAVLLALGLAFGGARSAGASGETVIINVGDIPANKTVTIVFNAQVNAGFSGTPSQVSNQGTISGGNFGAVVTDDPSTGPASDPTVTPIQVPTTTTVASSANPSVFSQSVTFTATVTSGSGTPTGTVNFVVDGGAPVPVALNGSGQATLTTSSLSIAGSPHSVVATFVENAGFGASSGTLTPGQTVNQASSQTAVASSVNPSVSGQPVTFTATVTGAAPATLRPLTGTVQFNVDGADVGGPVAINGAGVATSAPVTLFATGSPHVILATFSSTDANFVGSSGLLPGGQAVNKANTTAAVTGDTPDPSTPGQLVAVTYTVSVTAPGTGTPTGNVLVSDGVNSCTGTVAAGTCSVALTTLGARNLTATYQGDGNYNASPASPAAPHTVTKSDATAAITNESADPTVVGETFTVSYTVTPVPPASATPTGNVLVTDGVNSCTGTVAAGNCSLALVTVGVRTLTATYQGDATYNASPASPGAPHTVNKAATSVAITSDAPDPSVFGAPVVVNYTVSVTAPGGGTPTGSVLVSDGVSSCSGTVATGTCTLTLVTVGARTLTATYLGDASYNASLASPGEPHTVNKASTTAAITADPTDPSLVGQAVSVSYSVSVVAPGSGTPTGTVTITDGVDSCVGTLPATSCSITLTTAGARTLTATYNGDGNFNASPASAGEPHTVGKANTTAAITADAPDPSVVGQAVTVSYSVTVTPPGVGTPTGTVTVTDGVSSCTGTLPATSCSITLTTAGARTLTATYNGDASFNASPASPGEPHTVNKADTTAAITADPTDPSVTGQSVTISYSVTVTPPGAGTPTGTVTVTDGAGATCTGTLPALSCNITFTTIGAKSLTATYNGDARFNASPASAVEPHTVTKASTTATITADTPDPSAVGQLVAISYSVTANAPGSGTPTGNVTVTDGTDSCTGTVAAGSCSIAFTSPGSKTLTATYQGDANYNASPASAGEPHTVVAATTTTAITGDAPDPSVVGQPVVVSYTVTPSGAGTPTGTVTVTDGINSCTATVAAGQCTLALFTAGSRPLTATYSGDTNFGGSTSAPAPHTVAKANTTAAITADPTDPSVVGQPVTISYSVSVVAPGSGTPTGTVTVTDGTSSCTGTVAAGSCVLTPTTAGAKSLTATYNGEASYNASPASPVEPHVVNKADTTTTITSDTPDPSATGQAVTVNYAVAVVAPGSGTPTGNVTVTDGVSSCTGTVAAGTCTITFTTAGSRTLTATYAGDANYNTSTSAGVAHTVANLGTCAAPLGITADGGTLEGAIPTLADVWFTATLHIGRSYSIEFANPVGNVAPGAVTVFTGDDACGGTSTASVRDTTAIEPVASPGTVRLSFIATGTNPDYRIRLAGGAGIAYAATLAETTQYSPNWSTNGTFNTFYGLQNTTGATLNGTLTFSDTDGTVVSVFNFSVPPLRALSTDTAALAVARNKTGTATLVHDGPPGAIVVQASIANFTTNPPYVQPLRFRTLRESR